MNLSIGYKLNVTSKKHDLNPLFMHHCVKTKKAPLTPWMKGTFYNCPEPLTFKVKSPVLLPRRKMRLLHLTTAVCHDVVRKKNALTISMPSPIIFPTDLHRCNHVKWGRLWLFKDILMSLGRQSGAELGRC